MKNLLIAVSLSALTCLPSAQAGTSAGVNVNGGCFKSQSSTDGSLVSVDCQISQDSTRYIGGVLTPITISLSQTAQAIATSTSLKAGGGLITTNLGGVVTFEAVASSSELVTISTPGYSGPLTVDFEILTKGTASAIWSPYSASLSGVGSVSGQWTYEFNLGNVNNVPLYVRSRVAAGPGGYQFVSEDVNGVPASAFGLHAGEFSVMAGQPFGMTQILRVSGSGGATQPGFGTGILDIDLSHSTYWAGIKSVKDKDGNALGFSALSASGVDYAQSAVPVPEPGTWLQLLVGLTAVGAWFSRRKFPNH